jgi:DHA3 family macrolide efflux protein-like MFS transporter
MLWAGLSTSSVGDQLGIVAIAWIAVDAFGAAAGYLTALQAGITVVAGLLVARWTDGLNERWLMIAADAARAVVLGAVVAVWAVTGHASATALVVLVTALAVGQATFRPAVQAIMPDVAPSIAMLPALNALLDGTERLARLGGPALIALIASRLPTMHFLTLDAVSFLVSAAALCAIGRRPTRSVRARVSLASTMVRGFRVLRRDRLLRFLLHTSGISNGGWYAAMFLGVPLMLAHNGHTGADGIRAFGAVIACYGVTNFAANVIVGSRSLPRAPGRMILTGNILTGAGIVLMGASGLLPSAPVWAVCLAAAVAGGGGPINDIPRTTLMQTVPPPADVAAAFRAWLVMANVGVLVGLAAAPTLFDAVGAPVGIAMLGGAMVIVAVAGLLCRLDGPVTAEMLSDRVGAPDQNGWLRAEAPPPR